LKEYRRFTGKGYGENEVDARNDNREYKSAFCIIHAGDDNGNVKEVLKDYEITGGKAIYTYTDRDDCGDGNYN
jgi:hypothetical protein